MGKLKTWLNESTYISPLPPACKMCADGSKMVVLITGMCSANCFYCPLSSEKLGKDRIFADEWELAGQEDTEKLILEAEYIDATGAGITGGDPLVVWKRTKKYISLLKEKFGSDFHIHLYTSGQKNAEHIADLVSAGLDEIRFHPTPSTWKNMDKSPIKDHILHTLDTSCDVGLEIPVIPGMQKDIVSLISWAEMIGIKWINLNELEFSETNATKLGNKGYYVKDDISSAVKGSQELALKVIEAISKKDYKIGVHYCSSSFKDGIQLRNRIKRRAKNIAKNHEIISDDGTLIKGVVSSNKLSFVEIIDLLKTSFNLKQEDVFLNKEKNQVEVSIWILEEIAQDLKKCNINSFMVEEYPTADGLEVERIPLPI